VRGLPFDERLHQLQSRKADVRPGPQRVRGVYEGSGLPTGKTLLRSGGELFRGINSFRSAKESKTNGGVRQAPVDWGARQEGLVRMSVWPRES
jgi:hypothetical protein